VQCLESLTSIALPCYIAGDFNAATVDWLNLAATHHCGDNIILDFAINNGFLQIVKRATRESNILDIVLVNKPNTVFTVDVNAPLGSSDHCRVDFTIVIQLELSDGMADGSAKQLPVNKRYCWRDADYEGIANFLANYDWTQLFSLNPSVNEMWTAFNDVMHCAIDMCSRYQQRQTFSNQ